MSSSPPYGCGNGGGCSNDHRKVTAMTMMMTMTVDANADTNAPWQLQQQQQLPQQQRRNGKRWGGLPSKDVCGTGVCYIGGKQRPSNGGNDDHGGIIPAAGKCGRDPGGVALPPFLPPFPPAQ